MTSVVSLNGEIFPSEKARVSVFDRGFLYGDSVYEVLRTYGGIPFELERHMQRLEGSAERLGMRLPVPIDTLEREISSAHAASKNDESYLRIICTRGAGPIGLDPALAEEPLRVIVAQPLVLPSADTYEKGVTIALVSVRRNLRTAIDPMAKTGNYLNSVMAVAEARRRSAFEAVMLDHRDLITEGASSNLFAVVEGVLLTPALETGILKGVTRSVVFEVAKKAGIVLLEVPLNVETLDRASEVFITSSIREIVPVVRVDERPVGDGTPGPLCRKIRTLFAEYVAEYVRRRSV